MTGAGAATGDAANAPSLKLIAWPCGVAGRDGWRFGWEKSFTRFTLRKTSTRAQYRFPHREARAPRVYDA
jgi:hypothetical protein